MEPGGFRIISYPNKFAEFRIYAIADAHWLNRGTAGDHLKRDIKAVADDDNGLVFGLGDYADWITPGHPHFDPLCFPPDFKLSELAKYTEFVSKQIIEMFAPIASKCLGFGFGNHEWNYMSRRNQYEVHGVICKQLGVPDIWFSSFVDIYFVHDPSIKSAVVQLFPEQLPPEYTAKLSVFNFHGAGAPATAGGKVNRLKAAHDMVEANLILTGHLHEAIAKPFVRLYPNEDCTVINQRQTMALITGSYLRTYTPQMVSYGERRGYPPTTLGMTKARYTPYRRELTVEVKGEGVGIAGTQSKKV
jgi:hypothetical protein